jgi:hypothetical protein
MSSEHKRQRAHRNGWSLLFPWAAGMAVPVSWPMPVLAHLGPHRPVPRPPCQQRFQSRRAAAPRARPAQPTVMHARAAPSRPAHRRLQYPGGRSPAGTDQRNALVALPAASGLLSMGRGVFRSCPRCGPSPRCPHWREFGVGGPPLMAPGRRHGSCGDWTAPEKEIRPRQHRHGHSRPGDGPNDVFLHRRFSGCEPSLQGRRLGFRMPRHPGGRPNSVSCRSPPRGRHGERRLPNLPGRMGG